MIDEIYKHIKSENVEKEDKGNVLALCLGWQKVNQVSVYEEEHNRDGAHGKWLAHVGAIKLQHPFRYQHAVVSPIQFYFLGFQLTMVNHGPKISNKKFQK